MTPDITKIKREMREAAGAATKRGYPKWLSVEAANVLALLADHDALVAALKEAQERADIVDDGPPDFPTWRAAYEDMLPHYIAIRAERDALMAEPEPFGHESGEPWGKSRPTAQAIAESIAELATNDRNGLIQRVRGLILRDRATERAKADAVRAERDALALHLKEAQAAQTGSSLRAERAENERDALARQGLDPAGGAAAMREAAAQIASERADAIAKLVQDDINVELGAICRDLAAAIRALPIPTATPDKRDEALRVAREALIAAKRLRTEAFSHQDDFDATESYAEGLSEAALAALDALPSAPVRSEAEIGTAAHDVLAERERQKTVEGWTAEHDDKHANGELVIAAACYAAPGSQDAPQFPQGDAPKAAIARFWPWSRKWWKPKDRRRDLVRAGALILAEIERLDRLTPPKPEDKRDEVIK